MSPIGPLLSSDDFVWKDNRGVCDITDLVFSNNTPPNRFAVRSARTGRIVHFNIITEIVVGWRFMSENSEFFIDIIND